MTPRKVIDPAGVEWIVRKGMPDGTILKRKDAIRWVTEAEIKGWVRA